MPKTHLEIVEEADDRVIRYLCEFNIKALQELLHPDMVYTNDCGQLFIGIHNLQINDPHLLRIRTLVITERAINFFNNVAIVNTFEDRTGEYLDVPFEGKFRVTRVWKFLNQKWMIVAVSVVVI